ncbi:MAG: hypothetical protein COA94_00190 [Rickettsiales bacterium]|nr:MAG: hypothetical protein COA94_00190 [Rickettsiales bacterium]
MKKIFLLPLFLICVPTMSSAITLEQALVSGYNHDEVLKINKTDFLQEIEEFPRALAEFMPRITAGIDFSHTRRKSKNSSLEHKGSHTTQSVTLNQPIFNGGASLAKLKAARFAFRASMGKYYAAEQDQILKEIDAYLSCAATREKYAISKMSVKSNKTQLEAMKEKFKLGESTETEVAASEEGLATAESNQSIAYANYEASRAEFFRIFGVEAAGIKMPALSEGLPKSLEEVLKEALAKNYSIDQARYSSQASKSSEYASKGVLLPSVSLSVRGERIKFKKQDPARNRSNNNSVTSTISVKVPILEKGGFEYSEVRRAKHQTRKTIIALNNTIKTIKSQGRASWSFLSANKLRIKSAAKAVKAAEIAYDGVQQEEMLGSKTIIDVLRTEGRLNDARSNLVEAKKALVLAGYRIQVLMGKLTAKSMNLKVEHFDPEAEFKRIKFRIIGF